MRLAPFLTLGSTLHLFYGLDLNDEDIEEIGLYGWEHIGNKRVSMYQFSGCTEDCILELPCNADIIEAVTTNKLDYNTIGNISREDYGNEITESYIESRKKPNSAYYTKGKFLDYERIDQNRLKFTRDHDYVNVLYKGIVLDDEGLPKLTNKEVNAIAAYIAYVHNFKKALSSKDKATMEIALFLKNEWERKCDDARTPEYLNQNDMDKILNARNSWDRKAYNVSYKPVL